MRYPNNLYVILFLIIGTAIFVIIKAYSPKIEAKNLSFIMVSLGVNLLTIPVAFFIGAMTTDSPDSTELLFWGVFLFIQGIPLLILILALIWWFIRKGKEKIDT
ncbi:hypothetical protein CN675_21245 [Bacillus toyonensis]|uniref:hypothetical protein n=1 Tax=Bacillus TaxID=1386 RepID=UPI000B43B8AE|nr:MULTISPECIES: hypothetical protein [Bacillus cereus group]PEJ14569.1 hypothetical protein CN675_21245 [Bacillus toyonensis]